MKKEKWKEMYVNYEQEIQKRYPISPNNAISNKKKANEVKMEIVSKKAKKNESSVFASTFTSLLAPFAFFVYSILYSFLAVNDPAGIMLWIIVIITAVLVVASACVLFCVMSKIEQLEFEIEILQQHREKLL